jgi:hypothetical protein
MTDEDRALLLRVNALLEELIETFDILGDGEAMRCIRESEEDVKAGRVRGYGEFMGELKRSGEIGSRGASRGTSAGSTSLL